MGWGWGDGWGQGGMIDGMGWDGAYATLGEPPHHSQVGATQAPSCLPRMCNLGVNYIFQWHCYHMSTIRRPCIANLGVPLHQHHMAPRHVLAETYSAAKTVSLALLPQWHVLGVQVDVATLAILRLHQGRAHASARMNLQAKAIRI